MDQALFSADRTLGRQEVAQVVWIYEHPIDFDGLRRFQQNLSRGLLGRRIERSPLPFARDRWVSDHVPPSIDICEHPRPRTDVGDWADEHAQVPTDAEQGPGWHLGVLPLSDGSTAVSLVVSHYLIDGLGLVAAIVDAVLGNTRDLCYPPPRLRSRLRAAIQDARQTAADAPEIARALVVAAKLARRRQHDLATSPTSRPDALWGSDHGDEPVIVPGITICVEADNWDARAKVLNGTGNTLVAGFAAKLGERMGRRRAGDGAVILQLPISTRTDADTRANAMSFASVTLDPTQVTRDLGGVRATISEALTTMRENSDESLQTLWLTPFAPKRALKKMAATMLADPDLPVVYSNLGDLGSLVCRLDGTDADYGYARGIEQHVTRDWLEQIGGQMRVLSLRVPGKVLISVVAYRPGAENTKSALRELAAQTLAEFDLAGEIE